MNLKFFNNIINRLKMTFIPEHPMPVFDTNLYLDNRFKKLNIDQKDLVSKIDKHDKINICIPTGTGKGYMMFFDILFNIEKNKADVIAIATHRLMLNDQHSQDIFDILTPYAGEIGFIMVGSDHITLRKVNTDGSDNKTYYQWLPYLKVKRTTISRLIKQTTRMKDVQEWTEQFRKEGKKVIIVSTYQSLGSLKKIDIDKIYCDEAHMLASGSEQSKFKDDYLSLSVKKSVFFTATPKDLLEREGSPLSTFLMNNEEIFGIREGWKYGDCIKKAYITTPIVHLASPIDPISGQITIMDKAKFAKNSFIAHDKYIQEKSYIKGALKAKMLVKCSGVAEMWEVTSILKNILPGVVISAGASVGEGGSNDRHVINDKVYYKRNEYLDALRAYGDDTPMIILHVMTMTEGINVNGFTGVLFLLEKLPSDKEILQNLGRAMRLHSIDRNKLFNNELSIEDKSKWVKPYCAVIIPYWDSSTAANATNIANKIKKMSKTMDYEFEWSISLGDDMPIGVSELELPLLNTPEKRKAKDLIDGIKHVIDDIEVIYANEKEVEEVENVSKDGFNVVLKYVDESTDGLFD